MHLHYRSQGPPRRRRRVSSSDTVNLVTVGAPQAHLTLSVYIFPCTFPAQDLYKI